MKHDVLEVDEQKFPELLSLRPPNIVFLKLYAVSVKRQRLKFMQNEGETSSFSGLSPRTVSSQEDGLDEQLKRVEQDYRQLLEEHKRISAA